MERHLSWAREKWIKGPTTNSETLGIQSWQSRAVSRFHEGLYANQHGAWRDALLRGPDAKIVNSGRGDK